MSDVDHREILLDVTERYPTEALRVFQRPDVNRQVFHLNTVRTMCASGAIADIGGGTSAFIAACAELGMRATLIDDFRDPMNFAHGDDALVVHRAAGVNVMSRDVISEGLGLDRGSMDVITTFDSLEHWHNSPKGLLEEVTAALKPGGWFLMGVPNCVNLRKRLTVPMGHGKWSSMTDWYESAVFRGHVREPDVHDLRYIADDMGLINVQIFGRNWLGYRTSRPWARRLTPVFDRALQLRPSLCSDIYLLGQRPGPRLCPGVAPAKS